MRVLLIKMSSMGDVVHALPAITDACANVPGIEFDWVVEAAFAEIPAWHPGVKNVIPIAWRRWRKTLHQAQTRREIRAFIKSLRARRYDLVLDAQGLYKSALVGCLARGRRCGLDRASAREPLAALFYQRKITVAKGQHAILRLRQLFAGCFGYSVPDTPLDYGMEKSRWLASQAATPYVVFLHATTWDTKLWPEAYWRELCALANQDGYVVHLPWGNSSERERAVRIAAQQSNARVLDRLSLSQLARELSNAAGVVGVDTGLSHVAAALAIPCVTIYGATDPRRVGVMGPQVTTLTSHLSCSPCVSRSCRFASTTPGPYPPCYAEIDPLRVWRQLAQRQVVGMGAA